MIGVVELGKYLGCTDGVWQLAAKVVLWMCLIGYILFNSILAHIVSARAIRIGVRMNWMHWFSCVGWLSLWH